MWRLLLFLALALVAKPLICGILIVWLFAMRILMILTSLVSYFINEKVSRIKYGHLKDFDLEAPLTHLVWITSMVLPPGVPATSLSVLPW